MTEGYAAFLIFVAVATVSPGGATTLATASGMRYGVRRSVPYILGIGVGLGSMAVASMLGLAALPSVRARFSVTESATSVHGSR